MILNRTMDPISLSQDMTLGIASPVDSVVVLLKQEVEEEIGNEDHLRRIAFTARVIKGQSASGSNSDTTMPEHLRTTFEQVTKSCHNDVERAAISSLLMNE